MSAHVDAPALAAPAATATGLPSRKLAVWLFLGSEILFFCATDSSVCVSPATAYTVTSLAMLGEVNVTLGMAFTE